jgi:hypothetical protein
VKGERWIDGAYIAEEKFCADCRLVQAAPPETALFRIEGRRADHGGANSEFVRGGPHDSSAGKRLPA